MVYRLGETYAVLFIEQQDQFKKFKRDTCFKIIKAADIPLAFDTVSTPITWEQYVRLRALLAGHINEKFASSFLKAYFDEGNQRWLPAAALEQLLKELPSMSYPDTFRYMFVSLVRNWFRELGMFREGLFDCNLFTLVASNNLVLLKYIIQWIVGLFEPETVK